MFEKADVCLFLKTEKIDEKSIEYFTGVHTDLGVLLKFKKKQILYLSSLEERPKNPSFEIKNFSFEQVLKDVKAHFDALKPKGLKKTKAKTIGLHYAELSKKLFDFFKKTFKGYKLVDVGAQVMALRQIKSATEVKYLKKAISITEQIIFDLAKNFKKFTYEIEAVQFVKREMIKHNVVESFPTIVASGSNSKNPHYFPNASSKFQKGFIIVDMGVKYKGYCADITRTFYLGKPKQEELDFYNKIKDELLHLEKTVKPGMKKFTTRFKMVHMIGHGIGLDVHESPGVGHDMLKEGICIAMEPAIYTDIYGVRIEDDYQLTKTGVKRLSTTSRELMIIK